MRLVFNYDAVHLLGFGGAGIQCDDAVVVIGVEVRIVMKLAAVLGILGMSETWISAVYFYCIYNHKEDHLL